MTKRRSAYLPAKMNKSLRNRESKNSVQILKTTLAEFPGIGQFLKAWDRYRQDNFNSSVLKIIDLLEQKVSDIESLFSDTWLKTPEGDIFARKVLDAALDMQLADKQELFVNALINGIENKRLPYVEKLKFVDAIRQLCRPALLVLAELHEMYKNRDMRKEEYKDLSRNSLIIQLDEVIQKLGNAYDPHLIESCLAEMRAFGVFSSTGTFFQDDSGTYQRGYPQCEYIYSEYTSRFVEFLLRSQQTELLNE